MLFALPCGGDLTGGVVGREQRVEPGPCPVSEPVACAKETLSVGPCEVFLPAAAAVTVPAHPLADVGDRPVGEHHHVEVAHHDPGTGQCPPDPRRLGRAWVDRQDTGRVPEVVALQRDPVLHALTGATEGEPDDPPGRPGSRSTIEVVHGSDRCHGPVQSWPSRVSSIPIIAVGAAGHATAAAASTRIRWAVHHAIPHSAATSLTARFAPATAAPTRSRSLVVTRERAGSCALASVKDLRGHRASAHTNRRLRNR